MIVELCLQTVGIRMQMFCIWMFHCLQQFRFVGFASDRLATANDKYCTQMKSKQTLWSLIVLEARDLNAQQTMLVKLQRFIVYANSINCQLIECFVNTSIHISCHR
jgi:hypothetical protein